MARKDNTKTRLSRSSYACIYPSDLHKSLTTTFFSDNLHPTVVPVQETNPAEITRENTQQDEDKYIIHNPVTGVRIYALTLYNTHERQGAEEEANAIDKALGKLPCNRRKEKWWTQAQFENLLAIRLEKIRQAADCGLLMLFVMSHGSQGALHDRYGRKIFINNIVHQVTHPSWKPNISGK